MDVKVLSKYGLMQKEDQWQALLMTKIISLLNRTSPMESLICQAPTQAAIIDSPLSHHSPKSLEKKVIGNLLDIDNPLILGMITSH